MNISQRKQEAKDPYLKLVEVTENGHRPPPSGATNWPRQYNAYLRTSEATRTKYGGGVGPRGHHPPPQKAEKDPWLTRIFAGYLFAIDYRDRRGHAFMLQDQQITKRNVQGEGKQSGNCLHCHASIMPLYPRRGQQGPARCHPPRSRSRKGLELVAGMEYYQALDQLKTTTGGTVHPVSCVDCHSPENMELRVTRPGFINGIRDLAALR